MPKLKPTTAEMQARNLIAKIEYGRSLAGITKTELATAARMHYNTMTLRYHDPNTFTLGELRRISAKLHLPLAYLLSDKQEPPELEVVTA